MQKLDFKANKLGKLITKTKIKFVTPDIVWTGLLSNTFGTSGIANIVAYGLFWTNFLNNDYFFC